METGILMTESPPGSLGPHHERVHWSLHVDPLLIQPRMQHIELTTTLQASASASVTNISFEGICLQISEY